MRYEPTPPECFAYLLEQAEIGERSRLTFVDLGSGKGRVLLLAGLSGFRTVIGVEFGEELHSAACANIASMNHRLLGSDISSVHADARLYRFPPDPIVCFLNNPFGRETLAAVLDNLEESLRRSPRPFTIIYYHSNHTEELERRHGWQVVREGVWRDASHHFAIYRAKRY